MDCGLTSAGSSRFPLGHGTYLKCAYCWRPTKRCADPSCLTGTFSAMPRDHPRRRSCLSSDVLRASIAALRCGLLKTGRRPLPSVTSSSVFSKAARPHGRARAAARVVVFRQQQKKDFIKIKLSSLSVTLLPQPQVSVVPPRRCASSSKMFSLSLN